MSLLAQFAQTYTTYSDPYYYSSSSTEVDGGAVAGIIAVMLVFWFFAAFLALVVYVVTSISLMKIFTKAGAPAWAAWVPFYNNWKLLEIGGQQGFWAVLAIIPLVNIASIVFMYIAMYHIGLKLGKSGAFLLLGIFLPLVWYLWLAFDSSKWDDSKSSAPSLHHA